VWLRAADDALIEATPVQGRALTDLRAAHLTQAEQERNLPVLVLTMNRRPVILQAMRDCGARANRRINASTGLVRVADRTPCAGGRPADASVRSAHGDVALLPAGPTGRAAYRKPAARYASLLSMKGRLARLLAKPIKVGGRRPARMPEADVGNLITRRQPW
jgi:hypothetical protein